MFEKISQIQNIFINSNRHGNRPNIKDFPIGKKKAIIVGSESKNKISIFLHAKRGKNGVHI